MKIVVIGGVAAGMSFAAKMKRLDKEAEIVVYEKGSEISYAACGLPYYIAGEIKEVESLFARTKEEFEEDGLKVHLNHEVTKVDLEKKSLEGKDFKDSFDKLIIATGAEPVVPPLKNDQLDNIFTLKSPEDAKEILKALVDVQRVTIVGGGYIGLEMLEALLELRKEVRLIQRPERLLPKYDREFTDLLEEELKEKVTLHFKESVEGFEGKEKVEQIVTEKGTYETEAVILAVGYKPVTEIFKDELELLEDGSIKTDEAFETSVKDVYAIGDCAVKRNAITGEYQNIKLGTMANRQGKYLAYYLSGKREAFPGILGTNMIKVLDWEMAATGLSEDDARKHYEVETAFIKSSLKPGYMPVEKEDNIIYAKMIIDKESKRILGGQLMGKESSALKIQSLAVAIQKQMNTHELEFLDLGYHPHVQGLWDLWQTLAGIF